jgi:hypothetical protein
MGIKLVVVEFEASRISRTEMQKGQRSREGRVGSRVEQCGLEGRLRRVDASAGPMQGVGGGMRRRDFVGDRRQG